jgi:hypothetical protein
MKNEANEPAIAVTTKIPQNSRITSTTWPTLVTGFLNDEETVTICSGREEERVAEAVDAAALEAALERPDQRRADEVHERRENEGDDHPREEPSMTLAPRDQAPQLLSQHRLRG